jgi:two-component system copper resistance phosphate regulon response regulator CusR
MKLLLAEDERQAGEYLVKGLGENGWIVDWVKNGVDAVHSAAMRSTTITDVGLPQMDGWRRSSGFVATIARRFCSRHDRVEDRCEA